MKADIRASACDVIRFHVVRSSLCEYIACIIMIMWSGFKVAYFMENNITIYDFVRVLTNVKKKVEYII